MSRVAGTVLAAGASYSRYALSLLVLIIITGKVIRTLGPEAFGLWSLVFAVVGTIGLLDMGLVTTVVKYVAELRGRRDPEGRNEVVSTAAAVAIVLASVAAALVAGTAWVFNSVFSIPADQHRMAVLLIVVLGARVVMVGFPLSVFRGLLFGEDRIVTLNVIQAASILLYGASAWVALETGADLAALAWINLGGMALEHICYVVVAFRVIPRLSLSPQFVTRRMFLRIVSFSSHQLVVNVSALVRLRSDLFLIKLFLPLSAVALYAVGQKIAEQLHLFLKQGLNVLAPLAAELHGSGKREQLGALFLAGTKYALAAAIAIGVTCFVLGRVLITAWVGESFADAAPILGLLVTASALSAIESGASGVLAMTGHHRQTARVAGLSAVVNVAVSVALIGPLGLIGVAWGTLTASLMVDAYLVPRIARRAYGIPWNRFAREAIATSVVPGVGQYLVILGLATVMEPVGPLAIGAIAAVGLLVYAGLFFSLSLDRRERDLLGRLVTELWPGRTRTGEPVVPQGV